METLWFIIVALMLTAYVVLDGFDLGAGVIYLIVAKTSKERRTVLRAIGPVWDGNEVLLLAAGGTLYFAFPQLYASSFSGFYLPLMMVLWLLMLRAIGIEFRTHMENPVWQGFFDVIFSVDRKSTRLNSSHSQISYAVFCLKKKKQAARLAARAPLRGL